MGQLTGAGVILSKEWSWGALTKASPLERLARRRVAVGSATARLRKIGAHDFAVELCRRRHVHLDDVLDAKCQLARERVVRRELVVVVMHTLGFNHAETSRVFGFTRSSVMRAERVWKAECL